MEIKYHLQEGEEVTWGDEGKKGEFDDPLVVITAPRELGSQLRKKKERERDSIRNDNSKGNEEFSSPSMRRPKSHVFSSRPHIEKSQNDPTDSKSNPPALSTTNPRVTRGTTPRGTKD